MKKILLIKLAAVGDVLRNSFLPMSLKQKYSLSKIHFLTRKNAADLLEGNPYIDKIINIDNFKKIKENYDLVINLDEDIEACKIAASFKDKLIGFYLDDEGNVKPTKTAQEWYDMGIFGKKPFNDILKRRNKKTYQRIMLEILGLWPKEEKEYELVLNLSEKEKQFGKKLVEKYTARKYDFIIGINTGAGKRWPKKNLPEDKTIELIKEISKRYNCLVLLLGGPEEIKRNQNIYNSLDKQENVIKIPCNLPLRKFASVLNQCKIIITSDSLALHIATALKKKILVFFGPTSGHEIELYGRGVKLIPKKECTGFYKPKCKIEPCCTNLLTTKIFIKNLNKLI